MGSCLSSSGSSDSTSSITTERIDRWDELEEKPAGEVAAAAAPARNAQSAASSTVQVKTGNKYSTGAATAAEQEDATPDDVNSAAAEEVTPAANVTVTSLLDKYKQHEYRQPRKQTILTTASPDVILSRPPVAVHTADESDSEKRDEADEEEKEPANWQYQPSPVRAVEQRHDIAAMSQPMVLPGAIGLDDEFD